MLQKPADSEMVRLVVRPTEVWSGWHSIINRRYTNTHTNTLSTHHDAQIHFPVLIVHREPDFPAFTPWVQSGIASHTSKYSSRHGTQITENISIQILPNSGDGIPLMWDLWGRYPGASSGGSGRKLPYILKIPFPFYIHKKWKVRKNSHQLHRHSM